MNSNKNSNEIFLQYIHFTDTHNQTHNALARTHLINKKYFQKNEAISTADDSNEHKLNRSFIGRKWLN